MKKKFAFGLCLFAVVLVAITLMTDDKVLRKENDKVVVNKKSDDKTSKPSGVDQTMDNDSNRKKSAAVGQSEENFKIEIDGDSNKINEEIQDRFQELNSMADKRVDYIIGQAQDEFKIKVEKNEDISLFYSKYIAILEHYEAKTEAEFNLIYDQLENDIFQKKLPSTVGQEFREAFKLEKDQRMVKLLKELEKMS